MFCERLLGKLTCELNMIGVFLVREKATILKYHSFGFIVYVM